MLLKTKKEMIQKQEIKIKNVHEEEEEEDTHALNCTTTIALVFLICC